MEGPSYSSAYTKAPGDGCGFNGHSGISANRLRSLRRLPNSPPCAFLPKDQEGGRAGSHNAGAATGPTHRPTGRAAASYGDDLVLDQMKPDYSKAVGVGEVAGDSVLHHCLEVGPILALRENGVSEGAGVIPSLRQLQSLQRLFRATSFPAPRYDSLTDLVGANYHPPLY